MKIFIDQEFIDPKVMRNPEHKGEVGIAAIIALAMLLVLSVLAISISFVSNTDYKTMANFKRGEEAFLAGEVCVQEVRRLIEAEGLQILLFKQQNSVFDPIELTLDNGATCRLGPRDLDDDETDFDDQKVFDIPEAKTTGRVMRNTQLGGQTSITALPIVFTVTGKDSQDLDIADADENINTGTVIAVGLEAIGGFSSTPEY